MEQLLKPSTSAFAERVLVTGATGFVGRGLVQRLLSEGRFVRAAVREGSRPDCEESVPVGNIGAQTDWTAALAGIDAIVHLAARVHVMRDSTADPLAAYRAVNTEGTSRLAHAAAAAGVKRLVFVSTAKVFGESSGSTSISDDDPARPQDPYAVSKWEAEQLLHRIAAETGLEVVILRPPLVYGPGVGANFLRLMKWVDRGYPLPFGAVKNRRSLVAADNLVDAIVTCLSHPAAAGQAFCVTDGCDLSTAELIRKLGEALDRPTRLIALPLWTMRAAGTVLGRSDEVDRLLSSFSLNGQMIRQRLDWRPPRSVEQGLAACAAWYRETVQSGHP